MSAYQTENFTVSGYDVTIELHYDSDNGMPWIENDGHGEIRQTYAPYGRPEKAPGEVVLYGERGEYFLYDVQATTEKAKREGWGISGDTTGLTRAQIAALAVKQDMKYCRDFLTGSRYWSGYTYTVQDADGEEVAEGSCWGFDDPDYCLTEAKAEALAEVERLCEEKRKHWRAALREARERKFWALRGVDTVAGGFSVFA